MARPGRVGRAVGVGAVVAAGAALGFVAERALVHRRIVRSLPPVDVEVPLGSIAGELATIDGPDGMQVAVETYGPPDAPQLVLSHAWICTGRVWHEQILRMADRYRIVTYDQPGHGRTDPPASGSYDLDVLGDTLVAVIDAAVRPGPFVVAGHSLGGMAILNAVRRHPDLFRERLAGAALLATTSSARSERLGLELGIQAVARLERGLRRVLPTLREPRMLDVTDRLTAATSDLSYLVTRGLAAGPDADPAIVAFTQQMALDSGSAVMVGLIEAVIGVDEDDGLDTLAWMGTPTTVLVGTEDRMTPVGLSRRMARRTGGDLREVDGAGHMLPLEAPDEVVAVLRRYLDRASAPDGDRDGDRGGDRGGDRDDRGGDRDHGGNRDDRGGDRDAGSAA